MRGSWLLATVRLIIYLPFTLVSICLQCLLLVFKSKKAKTFPQFYHRLCAYLWGIDVTVRGRMSEKRPVLFVCNHSSYLDITILGSVLPASFVSKAEVAKWPLLGVLAKLSQSIFIERTRSKAKGHVSQLQKRLEAHDSLIFFPEGTSNDGNRTLEFKSSLFNVAETKVEGQSLLIQPVSIAYKTVNGIPMGFHLRPAYAWYGDMTLADHLFNCLGMGRLGAEVYLHPPVTIDQFKSRKELAKHCQQVVATGVGQSLSGKSAAPAPAPKMAIAA